MATKIESLPSIEQDFSLECSTVKGAIYFQHEIKVCL